VAQPNFAIANSAATPRSMPICHREEHSDVAIYAPLIYHDNGLLRCARNDGLGLMKTWSKSPVTSLQQTF
jgi:hypothetical protein